MAVGVVGSFLRQQLSILPRADRVRATVTPYTRVHRPAVLAFSQSIRENIGGCTSNLNDGLSRNESGLGGDKAVIPGHSPRHRTN